MQLVVEQPHAEADQQTGNRADDDRAESVGDVTTGGDGDQTGKRSVQTHADVGLAVFQPCKDHADDRCNRGCNGGRQEDGAELFNRGSRRAVEAVPAEPQDEHTQRTECDIVTRERADLDLAVFVLFEFADTCAEDLCADQSRDTADHVNRTGAGKIVEAELTEPAAAPDPVRLNGIDDGGDNAGIDAVGQEFCALRHRAGHDRGGRGAENEVEHEA